MSEQRKAIRNAVVSILRRANTRAGDNVVANRQRPPWAERLPALSIRTEDETIEQYAESAKEFRRELAIVIEINDKGRDETELSDRLDELGDRIEDILFADYTLGGTVDDLMLTSANTDFEEEGENVIGALKLGLQATYYEYRPSDRFNQKLADFDTANVQYDISGDGDEDVSKAEDTIDLTT